MSLPHHRLTIRERTERETEERTAAFRHAVLLALVFATLLLSGLLQGCTTPDVACGMKADYEQNAAASASGDIRLTWKTEPSKLKQGEYGNTQCFSTKQGTVCAMRFREAPDFNDVCGLARFSHELTHAMGAKHE